MYPRAGDSPILAFLIDAFPQVRVVFNHLMACVGDTNVPMTLPPITRYSTLRLHQFENVCVHLSGQSIFSQQDWPYRDTAAWQQTLLREFGAQRLMWGSDFPRIVEQPGYGQTKKIIDELLPELPVTDRQAILGGTAQHFLRLPRQP